MGGALEDVAHLASGLSYGHLARGGPLHQHRATRGLEQANGVLDQGGFAGTIGAKYRDQVALVDLQIDIMQHQWAIAVGKGDIFKLDDWLALDAFLDGWLCHWWSNPALADMLHHPGGRQLDLAVVDLRRQGIHWSQVAHLAARYVQHPFGAGCQGVFHTVLDKQDSRALVGQAAEDSQSLVS